MASDIRGQLVSWFWSMRSPISCIAIGFSSWFPAVVSAQSNIVPDDTLGTENSVVIPNVDGLPIELITGGATRGQNLFHSFQEFNILEGRGAYFANPEGISNIFSRVTGNNVSELLGTLGVLGTADLFLINPNGIIFGENASLDIGGSLVVTTADSIQFGEQGFFSATEPDAPPLLTIQPSAFFFNQIQPGSIANNSRATSNVLGFPVTGLQLLASNSLLFVGGEIDFDGGLIAIPNGSIELIALGESGTIELNNDLGLNVSEDLARANIRLQNNSSLGVSGNMGGEISLVGNNISIESGTILSNGIIGSATSNTGSQSGDIRIEATGNFILDSSNIFHTLLTLETGDLGAIAISGDNIEIKNNAQIFSSTDGFGDSSPILLDARENIRIINSGAVINSVANNGRGNAGSIQLQGKNITLENGASIISSTSGQGNSSFIKLKSLEDILVSQQSIISQNILGNFNASGGRIELTAQNIDIVNSVISNSIQNIGNSGEISLNASSDIRFKDRASITNSIFEQGVGNTGNITITAQNLFLSNGSNFNNFNGGFGSIGDVNIQVAEKIFFDGIQGFSRSGINNFIQPNSLGNIGSVNISAQELIITSGAEIANNVGGNASIGDILIDVAEVSIDGSGEAFDGDLGETFLVPSNISSELLPGGEGQAGNIIISSQNISLDNGAEISTQSFATGNSGDINLRVSENLNLINSSSIKSDVFQSTIGNAGNISITANNISLQENSALFSNSLSQSGNTGSIILDIENRLSLDSSFISSGTLDEGIGDGGIIRIEGKELDLVNNSFINTAITNQGDAGEITLTFLGNINLDSSFISSNNSGTSGNAGKIEIIGQNISLVDSLVSTNVLSNGSAGTITIRSNENISSINTNIVANVGSQEGVPAIGNVGDIKLSAQRIEFEDSAQIQAGLFSQAEGNAGNVELIATESIIFIGLNTGIATSNDPNSIGQASNIVLTAPEITLIDNAGLLAANQGDGNGGNINVRGDNLNLIGNSFISSAIADGSGGDIGLQLTEDLILQDSSTITARALNDSTGGNLEIDSRFIIAFPGNNDIIANAQQGRGGIINLTADSIFNLQERASFPSNTTNDLDASSETEGLDGTVTIDTPDLDPARGLANLPSDLVDGSQLIDRTCLATAEEEQLNRFVITGRGGLPASPASLLQGETTLSAEWLTLPKMDHELIPPSASQKAPEVVEIDSWFWDENGQLVLANKQKKGELKIPWLSNYSCGAS